MMTADFSYVNWEHLGDEFAERDAIVRAIKTELYALKPGLYVVFMHCAGPVQPGHLNDLTQGWEAEIAMDPFVARKEAWIVSKEKLRMHALRVFNGYFA